MTFLLWEVLLIFLSVFRQASFRCLGVLSFSSMACKKLLGFGGLGVA